MIVHSNAPVAKRKIEGCVIHDCQNELLKLTSLAVQRKNAYYLCTADFFPS